MHNHICQKRQLSESVVDWDMFI